MDVETIEKALRPAGMIARGGFHPGPSDGVPGDAATLVLVGNAGPALWRAFEAASTADERRAAANPLDDWTRRALNAAADALGAVALYPFGGPPHLPFQRWALRTGRVTPSPIGPLIDPEFGLWHAYRGALAFTDTFELPNWPEAPGPCETCAEKPCLAACPAGVFGAAEGVAEKHDVDACVEHVTGPDGADCREAGCLARRACPIGPEYVYAPPQAAFHMARFVAAVGA